VSAMRLEYHPETDSAYIFLTEIASGEAVRQVEVDDEELGRSIVIDLDKHGHVLGFEFPYDASEMLPREVLDSVR
jgi:uncharacterized protein YuzE